LGDATVPLRGVTSDPFGPFNFSSKGGYDYFPPVMKDAYALGFPTLELYAQEWSIAYNPKNSNYQKYHAAYQSAMQSVSPMSGAACRISPGRY
jgi:hypothetical protein